MYIFFMCSMNTGAIIDLRDISGMKALDWAEEKNQPQIAELLKAAGEL